MKKRLGLTRLREVEIPAAVDARILAHASFALARKRRNRKLRIIAIAAGAMICIGLTILHSLPGEREVISARSTAEPTGVMAQKSKPTPHELEKMQDFTSLDQGNYMISQLSIYSGSESWDEFI